jgi:uracil-DNA glycosylase
LYDAAGAEGGVKRASLALVRAHQESLAACARCPDMHKPVVMGQAVVSRVLLVGQAPGDKEPVLGRPFAWTAGKNLFKWFGGLGLDEAAFRARVYMAAVCRCFPGKAKKGGDRVPSPEEIEACRPWLDRELELLQPELVIPVGRLAIEQFLPARPLAEQIGRAHAGQRGQLRFDLIPLPHPSGASTWYHVEPGKTLTRQALGLIGEHPAWRALRE